MQQDLLAGTSAVAGTVSWLSVTNEVVQILAGIVAIITGCVYLYNLVRTKWLKNEVSKKDE